MFHDTTKLQNATRMISMPKKILLAKGHSPGLAALLAKTHRTPKSRTSPIFSQAERKIPSCPQRYRVKGFDSNLGLVARMSITFRSSNDANQGPKECLAILHPDRIRLPDTYEQLQPFSSVCFDPASCCLCSDKYYGCFFICFLYRLRQLGVFFERDSVGHRVPLYLSRVSIYPCFRDSIYFKIRNFVCPSMKFGDCSSMVKSYSADPAAFFNVLLGLQTNDISRFILSSEDHALRFHAHELPSLKVQEKSEFSVLQILWFIPIQQPSYGLSLLFSEVYDHPYEIS